MITRRDLLKLAVAAPAWAIGSKLGKDSKAAEEALVFTGLDELLDRVVSQSPSAFKVQQDMSDDSMTWTVLETRKTKHLPQGWDLKREKDRFNLVEIDRKQGMIHTFWIKKVPFKFAIERADLGEAIKFTVTQVTA